MGGRLYVKHVTHVTHTAACCRALSCCRLRIPPTTQLCRRQSKKNPVFRYVNSFSSFFHSSASTMLRIGSEPSLAVSPRNGNVAGLCPGGVGLCPVTGACLWGSCVRLRIFVG